MSETTETEKATWTIEEAAKYLGVSRNWLFGQVKAGTVPALRLGTGYKIPKALLEDWLKDPNNALRLSNGR